MSRAFGRPVEDYHFVREALSFYTARACEKLRAEAMCAGLVCVHVATNPFRKSGPQYSNSVSIRLDRPTAYTPTILAAALSASIAAIRCIVWGLPSVNSHPKTQHRARCSRRTFRQRASAR